MAQNLQFVRTDDLEIDAYNARNTRKFVVDDPELEESIRKLGVLEPLLARRVPGKPLLQIVCGSRRWRAACAAGVAEVPVIERDLTDLEALGISLAENLERNDLTSMEVAENVSKLWELLGDLSRETKMDMLNERFGFAERHIYRYLQVAGLSDDLKEEVQQKAAEGSSAHTDTNIVAGVATEKNWTDEEKKQALDLISTVATNKERREVLSELKKAAEQGKNPEQAFKEIASEKKEGRQFKFYMPYNVRSKFEQWCDDHKKDYQTGIIIAVEKLLEEQ